MSETKRRSKQAEPEYEQAGAPRQTRVTLAVDVKSKYRKVMPRADFGAPDGSAPPRRRPGGGSPRPSRPPRSFSEAGDRPARSARPGRSFSGDRPARPPRSFSGDRPQRGGFNTMLKAIANHGLPEAMKQIAETRELILKTAEALLCLAEELTAAHSANDLAKAQEIVTHIFENMSFQDLAGQRLMKVEDFFKSLEEALKTPPKTFADDRPRAPRRDSGERKPYQRREDGDRKPYPRRESGDRKFGPRRDDGDKKPYRAKDSKDEKPPRKSRLKGPQADGMMQNEIDELLKNL